MTGLQIEFKGADLKFTTLFTGANGPGIIADTDGQGTQFTMSNADCFWSSVYLESLMVMLIIPVRDFFDRFHYNRQNTNQPTVHNQHTIAHLAYTSS